MKPVTSSDGLGAVFGPREPEYRRLRAAVFRQPLLATSTGRRKPKRAKPKRPEWRFARLMRRRPDLVALCLLSSFFFGLYLSEKVQPGVGAPVQHDMRLAARAAMDIKDLVSVIGHGVTVSSVEARWFDEGFYAVYRLENRQVGVEAGAEFSDDALLFVMGHECAHALFRQHGFFEFAPDTASYQRLVREVAASVFGAHFAGRVRSRRGGEGNALTENLVEELRIASRAYAIAPREIKGRIQTGWDGEVRTCSIVGDRLGRYYGAECLIDRIDRICREHPDPWEAARTIAEKLHNVDAKTAYKVVPARVWLERR